MENRVQPARLAIFGFITVVGAIVGFMWWRRWVPARSWRVFRADARDVPPSRSVGVLSPTDVQCLLSELEPVTKWFQLGINLGLQTYELNKVQQDYHGSDQQMLQTLDLWLRRTPDASWLNVVSALEKMGENRVATNIRRKYIRGGIQTQSVQENSGTVEIARKNRQNIDGKFGQLLIKVCRKLREVPINIDDLEIFLKGFFPEGCIPEFSNITDVFKIITGHKLWDYWNYYPLKKLVEVFAADDEEIMSWLESYKQDLNSYKETTKLIDYIAVKEQQPARYDWHYYRKLKLHMPKFTNHTLKYIDELLEEFAELCDLPPRVVLVDRIYEGCVSIVWLIPSHLAPKIFSAAPHSVNFFCKHEITKVEFDGECIYQEEKKHQEKTESVVSVVQVSPSMKEGEDQKADLYQERKKGEDRELEHYQERKEGEDQKVDVYQEEMEHIKETGAAAMSASVVKMVPSIKEGDQKFELYQEEMEHVKEQISAAGPEEGTHEVKITIVGYECKFVDPLPTAFQAECPICKLVLREPYQATCCGTSFCQTCIHPLQTKKSSCPTCRGGFQVFPNKGLKQSLNQLYVYCAHKDSNDGDGCTWSGELQEFEKHLNENYSEETRLLGCKFVEIPCEFHYAGCKAQTTRKDVTTHTLEQLPYHTKLIAGKITEENKHNLVEELTKSLHHKDAVIHELQEKLTLAKTDSSKLQRKDEQVAQQMQKVTQSLPIYNQPIPIDEVFTMEKFQEHKENDSQWYSEPFYTHPRGYKMCLRVDANGYDKASSTHLSLFTCFMKGEFDSELPWPFYGQIVVELLNQNTDSHHHEYIIYYDHSTTEYAGRMRIGTRSRGWGNSRFVSHAKLLKNSGSKVQYLKDNCLKFRVREVQLYDRDSENRPSSAMQCIVA